MSVHLFLTDDLYLLRYASPASTKAAFNMNLIAVLNINQSAYEPKKLTQRRSMVRWQKNITSQTAKKNMKLSSLSAPAQPPFSERQVNHHNITNERKKIKNKRQSNTKKC